MTMLSNDGCSREDAGGLAPRSQLTPVMPTRVGRYRVIARLGQGGMGEAFLAVDEHLHGVRKLVVVKMLHAHLHYDPQSVRAFLEEGRVALSMNHTGIVQSLDVGQHDGRHYLVMEFLHGQNLAALLQHASAQGARLPCGVAVRTVADALEGLQFMHEARGIDGEPLGLVHRDICPRNLFVTYHGETKLLDFGITKSAIHPSSTQLALLKGKLCYLSPELASGQPPDARTDVWSMGVVLWEALCGRRLFDGPSEVATLQQVLNMPIEQQYPHDVEIPPAVHQVLMRALDRDPARRYPSAAEMRDDLADWLGAESRRASRTAVRDYIRSAFGPVMDLERKLIRDQLGADFRSVMGSTASWPPPMATTSGFPATLFGNPHALGSGLQGVDAPGPQDVDAAIVGDVTKRVRRPPPPPPPSYMNTGGRAVAAAMPVVYEDDGTAEAYEGEMQEVAHDEATGQAVDRVPSLSTNSLPSLSTGGVPPLRTQPPPSTPTNGERIAWAAAAAALLLVIGLLVWRRPDPAPVAEPRQQVPQPQVRSEATAASAAPAVAQPSSAPIAAKPSSEDSEGPEAAEGEGEKKAPQASQERPRRDAARARKRDSARRKEREAAAAVVASLDDRSRREPAGFGSLTLDTSPWSEVFLGDRDLGKTPVVNARLPAGEHELILKNPELGIRAKYRVTIEPDATLRKRLAID